jgi:hypothetical protein
MRVVHETVEDGVGDGGLAQRAVPLRDDDAATLAREFAPLDATALLSLARFEAAARLSIAGHTSAPFTLRTLAPAAAPEPSLRDEIVAASRQCHGKPIAEIDTALEGALGKTDAAETEPPVGELHP